MLREKSSHFCFCTHKEHAASVIEALTVSLLKVLRLNTMDSAVAHSLGLADMRLRKGTIFHK